MKEYRIVTHFTGGLNNRCPWNAFIFQPEFKGQTPMDYLAGNCGLMDREGTIASGATEAEAVAKLFHTWEPDLHELKEIRAIFAKNSEFGSPLSPKHTGEDR